MVPESQLIRYCAGYSTGLKASTKTGRVGTMRTPTWTLRMQELLQALLPRQTADRVGVLTHHPLMTMIGLIRIIMVLRHLQATAHVGKATFSILLLELSAEHSLPL
jgi:hypothetical protein